MFNKEEFMKKFNADQELEVQELTKLIGLVKFIEAETYFKFKTRLNKRKNKSLVITSGSLYRKVEVLVDSNKDDYTTVTILDKEGYETTHRVIHMNEIKTAKDLALLIGVEEENYDSSAKVKAY